MTDRRILLPGAFSLLVSMALLLPPAFAQEVVAPEVANSRYQFIGAINAAAVYVRSGPGDTYYPTARLEKGTQVRVVGMKFEWLKIVPPEGSFSVVGKAFVERDAGGNTGRISGNGVNIRAGSALSNLKVTVQCKLDRGAAVTILGEQDEYYQIQPPADAFLYVHQRYVDPVKQVNTAPMRPGELAQADPVRPTTRPSTQPSNRVIAQNPPATQPSNNNADEAQRLARDRAAAEAEYERLEGEARAAENLPLAEQPLADLLSGFEKLAVRSALPASMRRNADVRIASLRVKAEAQREVLETRKMRAEAEARLAAIRAGREPVEQKIANSVVTYAAIGALQASRVQVGAQTLYRLTDPETGATACYVRTNEPGVVALMGKIVGVKGQAGVDPKLSLRVVDAEEIVEVDPAKVNNGITAPIIPPSLVGGTASTGTN